MNRLIGRGVFMLDDIIEIILELILDGMIEATGSKKVPMPIRIGLGVLLTAIVIGVCGLLLYVGIGSGSILLIIISVVLLAAAAIWVYSKIKKHTANR